MTFHQNLKSSVHNIPLVKDPFPTLSTYLRTLSQLFCKTNMYVQTRPLE